MFDDRLLGRLMYRLMIVGCEGLRGVGEPALYFAKGHGGLSASHVAQALRRDPEDELDAVRLRREAVLQQTRPGSTDVEQFYARTAD